MTKSFDRTKIVIITSIIAIIMLMSIITFHQKSSNEKTSIYSNKNKIDKIGKYSCDAFFDTIRNQSDGSNLNFIHKKLAFWTSVFGTTSSSNTGLANQYGYHLRMFGTTSSSNTGLANQFGYVFRMFLPSRATTGIPIYGSGHPRLPTTISNNVPKKNSSIDFAKTWKSSRLIPHTSKLSIGGTETLTLKGMQFTVRVDGFRARVLLDCFYYNDQNSQLEGTFKLRLPNNASPYFLAFGNSTSGYNVQKSTIPFISYASEKEFSLTPEEIMKQRSKMRTNLKEARIVEKEKAAWAYKKPVVERRDPALMEWAGADVFNCRVYPLMPKSMQHIVIGYDLDLTQTQQGRIYSLPIPQTSAPIKVDFDLAVQDGFKPILNFKTTSLAQENRWKIHLDSPKKELQLQYPKDNVLLVDKTHPHWAASFPLEIDKVALRPAETQAIFLVDVSLSSNPEKFRLWLKLLESILKKNQEVIQEFAVLFFNVETFWWQEQFVTNEPNEVRKLMAFTENLCLEGATDLAAALKEARHPTWNKNANLKRFYFLLSDGAMTWGESELNDLSNMVYPNTLFAYQTGLSGTDSQVLSHLTSTSGGVVFSVTSEDQIANASTAFCQQPWRLIEMQLTGGSDLLMAGRPQYLYAGQNILLAGRGIPSQNAECTLVLQQGAHQQKVTAQFPAHFESPLAQRCYGQIATNQLEAFGDHSLEASISYAKHYRVPGQTCSLLMLESEADYRRHQIVKTDSVAFIHNKYASQLIKNLAEKVGLLLGKPKENFKLWYKGLHKIPAVRFNFPAKLNDLIAHANPQHFQINVPAIQCEIHKKSQVSSETEKALNQPELDAILLNNKAETRKKVHGVGDSIKLLSSLIENSPGDSTLARDVAFSLMAIEAPEQAYYLLHRVLRERPHEPQTYYLMAQTLASMKKYELAIFYYEIALAGIWEPRFDRFNLIVEFDYCNFLKQLKNSNLNIFENYYVTQRLESLGQNLPKIADILVTITWNTDDTDIDLHVFEPNKNMCDYGRKVTNNGGKLFQDITKGYGPEMYLMEKAVPGQYEIKVKYFSGNVNRLSTPTKVYVSVYQNWGKKNETVLKKVLTLTKQGEFLKVATLEF